MKMCVSATHFHIGMIVNRRVIVSKLHMTVWKVGLYSCAVLIPLTIRSCEISSSHGGEYDVQSCLLGCTAV
jgi:hypothetical protein